VQLGNSKLHPKLQILSWVLVVPVALAYLFFRSRNILPIILLEIAAVVLYVLLLSLIARLMGVSVYVPVDSNSTPSKTMRFWQILLIALLIYALMMGLLFLVSNYPSLTEPFGL
jgi:hypothetical protein